ncbi:MAG: hypothetical protein JRL30_15640 [Deltaproteobacteria bacterium]|nr:hypothetical protein [Deltaproteobacteria bacterium]
MQMLSSKICKWFLVTSLLLGLAGSAYSMSQPPTEPVLMEFVRVGYEKDAGAIVAEWIVPNIDAIEDLSRIELLICHANNEATFGVMLNRSDRCNPIPPDTFGVILDPASDDRSIKNVSSAGFNVEWDQASPHGTLLKQSAAGVIGGNLGIGVWIAPQDWNPGRYVIKTRAVKRKHSPAPWQKLATFDYSGKGVSSVMEDNCLVKPVFFDAKYGKPMTLDNIRSVTLISYKRQKQDEGVTMKRWAGDTSGQHKYVVKEKRELKLSDFPEGVIPLEPGIYQFKHNSVTGRPPSGFYGESSFFEIKPGEETLDVQIPLYMAI